MLTIVQSRSDTRMKRGRDFITQEAMFTLLARQNAGNLLFLERRCLIILLDLKGTARGRST